MVMLTIIHGYHPYVYNNLTMIYHGTNLEINQSNFCKFSKIVVWGRILPRDEPFKTQLP